MAPKPKPAEKVRKQILNVRLTDAEYDALCRRALKLDRSMSAVVRTWCRRALGLSTRKKRPTSAGVFRN